MNLDYYSDIKRMDTPQGDVDQPVGTCVGNEQRARAQDFKNSGNEKFNQCNYKGAVIDYKKGLLHDQNNSDLHANLAAAYIHLEKYLEAEEHAVFAIQLRPNFYKGYMRAAKAAHGKGMTGLALKRLNTGLTLVSDANGIKELTRLKTQYTSYLSLKFNAEQQPTFDALSPSEDDYDVVYSSSSAEDIPAVCKPIHFTQETVTLKNIETSTVVTETPMEALTVKDPSKSEGAGSSANTGNILQSAKKESKLVTMPVNVEEHKTTDALPYEDLEPIVYVGSKETQKKPAEKTNQFKSDSFSKKQPDKFLEMCKDLTRDPQLKKHIAEFKEHLKIGSEAFLNGSYRKAVESYKAARDRAGLQFTDFEIDDRQYHVIKYAQCTALINLDSYEDIIKAIYGLMEMMTYELSIPALHIQLSRAYCKLNRFKIALEPLEKLQEIIDNCPIFPAYFWPGTTETIQETTPTGLKNALKELNQICRMSHKPSAVCRFDNCLKISTHVLPSELIYSSDPDFIGYVRMICEEKCHIEFHIACWKSYKESIYGFEKISDKDLLGRRCLTTDCINSIGNSSRVTSIEIISSDGQVKTTTKLDPKANNDPKKSKKKKCKLDDKEKNLKARKTKGKKARELFKKTVAVIEDEEEQSEQPAVPTDRLSVYQIKLQSLQELRKAKYGLVDRYWNPQLKFYGRTDETDISSYGHFMNYDDKVTVEVRDAKEFLFSYFHSILKKEGPLKQSDIEDIWKTSSEGYCDMKVVLPNLKKMCDLLNESTRFCTLEDYICLSEQIDELYETVKDEVSETVMFLMTGSTVVAENSSESTSSHSQVPYKLEDLLAHLCSNAQTSSEDESEYDEDNSGGESEESDEDGIDEEDNIPDVKKFETPSSTILADQVMPPKPSDSAKFSLQEMLNEMTRVKSFFMPTDEVKTCQVAEEIDLSKDKEESTSNETFETANGGSVTANDNLTNNIKAENSIDNVFILSSSDDNFSEPNNEIERPAIVTCEDAVIIECEEPVIIECEEPVIIPETLGQNNDDFATNIQEVDLEIFEKKLRSRLELETDMEELNQAESDVNLEYNKELECRVQTEEKHVQTCPVETMNRLSQTRETDLYKDMNRKLEDLSKEMGSVKKEYLKLSQDISDKEKLIAELKISQNKVLERLREETVTNMEKQKAIERKLGAEFFKKENEFKRKERELNNSMAKMKENYTSLLTDHDNLKKQLSSVICNGYELKRTLSTARDSIKACELKYSLLEENGKTKLQQSQKMHLQSIKNFWEYQITLLKKRCVEKISEMQNWFSMFPPEDVEDLPSWEVIRLNLQQWSEITLQVQQIEATFQEKYNELENEISRCGEVENLGTAVLPPLPDEPSPLLLHNIHKETSEKQQKKITELTQLVVNQQLEIEKSKETNQQIQHLMNSFQTVSRVQSPLTTAFGSLARQYPYPQTLPSQYGQANVSNLSTPSADTLKVGNAAKMFQADVQTLLQESSKAIISFPDAVSGKQSVKEENATGRGQTPPVTKSFVPFVTTPSLLTPQLTAPVPQLPTPGFMDGIMAAPPPPIGVAHNLLKTSSVIAEKNETKAADRAVTPKLENAKISSSREGTPVRATPSGPTPEKSKKKKKSKSESKDIAEARLATPVDSEASSVSHEMSKDEWPKEEEWSVVGLPKAVVPKHSQAPSLTVSESKLKNKKRLLDKLQHKFPTTSLRDLDEIVKLVREQNNGSLSGLPFDEIEARVERLVSKRHFQKTTTMGLDKFSEAAWGTVKQQEIITWTSLQLEECTICLEPMGNEKTRVDCNHEFHTKCLRKWLKEKSICPLCNKFTTMPDEFPAL